MCAKTYSQVKKIIQSLQKELDRFPTKAEVRDIIYWMDYYDYTENDVPIVIDESPDWTRCEFCGALHMLDDFESRYCSYRFCNDNCLTEWYEQTTFDPKKEWGTY